jgi:hypothetical protein
VSFACVPSSCASCGEVVFAESSGRGNCEVCGSAFELDFILRRGELPTVQSSVKHGLMRAEVNRDACDSQKILQEIER